MSHRNTLTGIVGAVALLFTILSQLAHPQQQSAVTEPKRTQIVLLGTGNPAADPDRSGPATAIVVNGAAYLVDFGAGVVRRAKAAVVDKGITALEPKNLRILLRRARSVFGQMDFGRHFRDLLVAVEAARAGATLVTENVGDFARWRSILASAKKTLKLFKPS